MEPKLKQKTFEILNELNFNIISDNTSTSLDDLSSSALVDSDSGLNETSLNYDTNDETSMLNTLSTLFEAGRYTEVLVVFPNMYNLTALSNPARIIAATSLFFLGRISAALREMAITIDNEQNLFVKERYILCMIQFLKQSGRADKAVTCYRELIYLTKITLMLKDQTCESKTKAHDKIRHYKTRMHECSQMNTVRSNEKGRVAALHQQAESYLKADGMLESNSLGRLCIYIHSLIQKCNSSLSMWKLSHRSSVMAETISCVYEAILAMGPQYLYKPILKHRSKIFEYLKREKYCLPFYKIDDIIIRIQEEENDGSSTFKDSCTHVIKSSMILGFIESIEKNFARSISIFNQLLLFLDFALDHFRFCESKSFIFSSTAKSVTTVLLWRSYIFGKIQCSEEEMNDIFSRLVNTTQGKIKSEVLSGRLAVYFTSFGSMFEVNAVNSAAKIIIENGSCAGSFTALRLDQGSLEEMIRKYIIASAMKANDDPSVIKLYDRIIWGLLCCGGVHLKTLWFFIFLKQYYSMEFDFGPLHLEDHHEYMLFPEEDIIGKYENGWEIVDKVLHLGSSLRRHERHGLWDQNNGDLYLLPQIFDAGDKLLLADQFYYENSRTSSSSFVAVSNYQVKHKLKSHIKVPGKITQQRVSMSRELILLWLTTFEEFKDKVPSSVSRFLLD